MSETERNVLARPTDLQFKQKRHDRQGDQKCFFEKIAQKVALHNYILTNLITQPF
jgi:hypothetical protein